MFLWPIHLIYIQCQDFGSGTIIYIRFYQQSFHSLVGQQSEAEEKLFIFVVVVAVC